jgi:hypothetical protein
MDMSDVPRMPKASISMKFLIRLAGADEETLRRCPPQDWDNVRAVGELMICTWLYQTGLFSVITHRLFAPPGQIRPELVLISMFGASFISLIDSYMVMRSGWHLSGIEELKRGGIDVSGGPLARIKANIFLAIRILLSIGIAQLTAIFLSIIIFAATSPPGFKPAICKRTPIWCLPLPRSSMARFSALPKLSRPKPPAKRPWHSKSLRCAKSRSTRPLMIRSSSKPSKS